ncbi:MAG: hypothetical protein JXR15_00335 [Shimia sp.]|uniref:hypothetical protein n=1 Tax=Shimia sp. TaxID=1954381 RepID=UPI003B8E5EE4
MPGEALPHGWLIAVTMREILDQIRISKISFAPVTVPLHKFYFFLMISTICRGRKKVSFKINRLILRLIFKQCVESSQKQGKSSEAGKISSDLSTASVDLFMLASVPSRLQPEQKNHI